MEVFDAHMPGPNQIDRRSAELHVTAADLLPVPEGQITPRGPADQRGRGRAYLESWLRGNGCVPIFNLMEDAATAEISRAQIWQWIRHPRGALPTAPRSRRELVEHESGRRAGQRCTRAWAPRPMPAASSTQAGELFLAISTADEFVEFLTLPAYEQLDLKHMRLSCSCSRNPHRSLVFIIFRRTCLQRV